MMVRAEKNRTDVQRRLAENNYHEAFREKSRAELLSANLTMDRALSLCERGEVNRGLLWMARALAVTPGDSESLKGALRANLAAWSRQLTSLKAILRHPTNRVAAVVFRPESHTLITVNCFDTNPTMNVTMWDAATGKPMGPPAVFEDPLAWINDANGGIGWSRTAFRDELDDWFSPDRTVLLVADNKNTARLREVATGRAVAHPSHIKSRSFVPRSAAMARGSRSAARIGLRECTRPRPVRPVVKPMAHEGWVTDVAFSPDGRTILTASTDKTARLWNAATGEPASPPLSHGKEILRAGISPDGKTVVTGGFDGIARLWDVATAKPIGKPLVHAAIIFAVAFSPDSKTVLTGSMDRSGRLWNAATGEPKSAPLRHESELAFVTFSPDGRTAVTCGDDNTARLWDADTGRPVGSPLEHLGTVNHATFSSDGSLLVTAAWDFEAQVWDTATSLSHELRLQQPSAVSPRASARTVE